MLDRIIRFSLHNRLFVIAAAMLVVIGGVFTALKTEVDVFPDLNAPTVVVMTEAGGMATEEVEQLVTFPIETAVNGATGVRRVRSQSTNGFSVVWVEFDWDTDIYLARQIVNEKLSGIGERMPVGVSVPVLGPQSSILGEVMIVSLTSDSTSLLNLRTLADWVLRPRLLSTGGVAQVSVHGGDIKEYQIVLNHGKMKHYGVRLQEVMEATRGMNENKNGGVVYEYGNEYIVRGITSTGDIDRIAACLVRKDGNSLITLADIADVRIGAQSPKLGVASEKGKPAVLLTVTKQPGKGTIELTRSLDAAIAELKHNLPADVHISTDIFRQSDFIENSISNVSSALLEGAFFVVIILFLFLANVRITLISLVTIPLSFLVTIIFLHLFGISINTMTLGGLAIAIGSLVDDAIVDVENVNRRLAGSLLTSPNGEKLHPDGTSSLVSGKGLLDVVYQASREVRMPILNSTLIIVVSFVPLFFLDGMEGKMLIPLGIAFITSLFASTCVALTLTPVLCSYILHTGVEGKDASGSRIARVLRSYYALALSWVMQRRQMVLGCTMSFFAAAVICFFFLGSSFLPPFNEGSFTINISSLPGISLEESDEIGRRAEHLLLEVPEIKTVARKTGRAELDEHALGVNVSEIEAPFVLGERSHQEVLNDIRQRLSLLVGANVEIGQPISHRIDAMLSGTQANIAIKLFGTDLNRMFSIGNQIKEAIEDVPGIADLNVEQQVERPELKIVPNRELLVRNGITMPEFNEFLSVNLSGEVVSQVYEAGRSYNLVVKADRQKALGEEEAYGIKSPSMEDINNLIIDTRDGRNIPLTDVAEVVSSAGPNTVNRENCQRKIVISANTAGRDLGSVVEDIRTRISEEITLPEGYRIEYGGQFESQQNASNTLLITCIVSIIIIFLLLFMQFRNVRESAVILLNLPLALIGSVFTLMFTSGEISVPAIIGFISLFGIATRNGMLLITEYKRLQTECGFSVHEAVVEGSLSRLNPILMTALTSALALVPLALGGDVPGNEIQSPMAKVILGGLISSTLLNAFIIPIVYEWNALRSVRVKPSVPGVALFLSMLALNANGQSKDCYTSSVSGVSSVDSVLKAVLANNLRLKALVHENEADILDLRSENVLGAPSIEYSPFFQGGKSGVQNSELIVSQQFDFPTQYIGRRKKTRLQTSLLDSKYLVARREIALQTRLLCMDIIRMNQVIDMLDRRLADAETVLHLFEKRLEAGDANILELNKAKLERMDVKKQKAQAESERVSLVRQLQDLNGGIAVELRQTSFPEYLMEKNFDAFLQRTIDSDASVRLARAGVETANQDISISRQSWLPALTVGYRRDTEGSERFNGFLVGASFPLFSTKSKIRAAKERGESARILLDDTRRQAESEIRTRYEEMTRLHSVLDHTDVELLQQTLQLLQLAIQHGELTALQYYAETTSIYEKLQSHIDLHCMYSRLMVELYRNEY